MKKLLIHLYRISAFFIVSAPIALNIFLQGSLISSLVYIPLLSVVLASMAIYLDAKLIALIESLQTTNNISKKHHSILIKKLNSKPLRIGINRCCYYLN